MGPQLTVLNIEVPVVLFTGWYQLDKFDIIIKKSIGCFNLLAVQGNYYHTNDGIVYSISIANVGFIIK